MPPEENKNNNTNLGAFRSGIDPVFKSSFNKTPEEKTAVPLTAYNVLNNQGYSPSQTNTPNPKPTIPGNTNPKSIIRTFKGDIESAIAANHLSSINIAIAENQKKQEQIQAEAKTENAEPEIISNYSENKILLFISLVLIMMGIVGVAITSYVRGKNTGAITEIQTPPSLITTEYRDELDTNLITKGKLPNALSSKLNDISIPGNNFYSPYLTLGTSTAKRLINSSELISLMKFEMPDIMKRSLRSDFMVGIYSADKNLPFIIFKTTSFENTYAGMLEWEKNLEKNMQVLFRLVGYQNSGSILEALTPSETKTFKDGVIVNKDVRLLRNENDEITLLYAIIDKETVIITVNDIAFKEILNRLNKENTLER